MSRAEKMYDKTPELKRDDESGKVGVKKSEAKSARVSDGTEGIPIHARHAMERRDVHHRHETEHMMHDHGSGGSKAELHARHLKEMGDMLKRHEKEIGKK